MIILVLQYLNTRCQCYI